MTTRRRLSAAWQAAMRVLAVLAVSMLVATGASHELLHMDERGTAGRADVEFGVPDVVQAPAAHGLRLASTGPRIGCSAHSASAHAAAFPPACPLTPAPSPAPIRLSPGVSRVLADLTEPVPHGPPRA